jgi:glycerophosphoryl diester phosphodiesterase
MPTTLPPPPPPRPPARPFVVPRLAIVVSVAILLYFGAYLLFMPPRTSTPEILAHRGDSAHAPENTLAAFRRAVRAGVDWIEFDVQRTKDGVLVVFHDDNVDRVTTGTGRVADLTLAQVQSLRVGGGERVPTFHEIVTFAKAARVRILPEAKNPDLYPGIAGEMVALVRNAGYLDRTVIQSFDHDVLEAAMRREPNIQVCALTGLWQLSLSSVGPPDAGYVCPMAEMIVLNPWMVAQAHSRRLRVFAWFGVVEHPLTMRALLALGVDGLIVDDPAALARILGR